MTLTVDTEAMDARTSPQLADVHLTAVNATHPALARHVRTWDDPEQTHRAVMALFPATLPGHTHERRATSGILYRVETTPTGHLRVLIQHAHPLAPHITDVTTVPLARLTPHLVEGATVQFRLDANAVTCKAPNRRREPVRNTTHPAGQAPEAPGDAEVIYNPDGTITFDRLTPWLRRQLAPAITGIELTDAPGVRVQRRHGSPLHIARFNGYGTITDLPRLHQLLATGIGRGKAYGCGLLSLAPAAPAT